MVSRPPLRFYTLSRRQYPRVCPWPRPADTPHRMRDRRIIPGTSHMRPAYIQVKCQQVRQLSCFHALPSVPAHSQAAAHPANFIIRLVAKHQKAKSARKRCRFTALDLTEIIVIMTEKRRKLRSNPFNTGIHL